MAVIERTSTARSDLLKIAGRNNFSVLTLEPSTTTMFESLKNTIRRSGGFYNSSSSSASSGLPVYSPLTTDTFPLSPTEDTHNELKPAQRHAMSSSSSSWPLSKSSSSSSSSDSYTRPSLARFLADFTLGFADGLTVPFALTAGLSSLGQTETVIYAGMAEICAGSISMGIGGYLSAKGDMAAADASASASAMDVASSDTACDSAASSSLSTASSAFSSTVVDSDSEAYIGTQDEKHCGVSVSEKTAPSTAVDVYLAPLDLPRELLDMVRDHVASRHDIANKLALRTNTPGSYNNNDSDSDQDNEDEDKDEDAPPHPVVSGFSVALGYLIGGSLPLFPYFLVNHVGDGLLWSFVVCLVALFTFGFVKDFVLHLQIQKQRAEAAAAKDWVIKRHSGGRARWQWQWKDVRRSSWEGLQMVILGSLAAAAAVLCVRLFNGMGYDEGAP